LRFSLSEGRKTPAAKTSIGQDLVLEEFSSPAVVRSGESFHLKLSIKATNPTRIEELAILFYSPLETRIGIVDLRACRFPSGLEQGGSLTFDIHFNPPCLVEGVYRLGLYINSTGFAGDLLGLSAIEVMPQPVTHVAYPAASRGIVELGGSISFRIGGRVT